MRSAARDAHVPRSVERAFGSWLARILLRNRILYILRKFGGLYIAGSFSIHSQESGEVRASRVRAQFTLVRRDTLVL